MKSKLKILFFSIIGITILFMVYKIANTVNKQKKLEKQIQTLPPFAFYTIKNNNIFTEDSLKQSKCLLIMYFHPDCDFCHAQLEEMNHEINKFSGFQILLISNADKEPISSLLNNYQLSKSPNISILQDKDFVFSDIFGKSPVPTSLVYSKSHKLLKRFKGKVRVDSIIKLCN